MQHAGTDMQARMLKEQQVEAARVEENLRSALDADGETLLSVDERKVIEDALARMLSIATGSDVQAIKAAIEVVDNASQGFAAKRMDNSIRQAFAGQSVDNI
jgi:molecular chaperone HscA